MSKMRKRSTVQSSKFQFTFVFGASGDVRLELAAINGRIPQTAIVRLHVHFGADAALQPFVGALYHLRPECEVLLRGVGSVRALDSLKDEGEQIVNIDASSSS